jgi:rhamnosyltransferase
MTPAVSIVIPVKNGGEDLTRCLSAIRAQSVDDEPEVVVVDSGSTDTSVATARDHGARVVEIAPEEFDHGKTRNLAVEAARGEVLVFISQDAEPVGDAWLAALIAPLADERVAGVYGRQVARPDAVPPEVFFLDFVYGPEPRVQELGDRAPSMETTLFSNVNSAIRRSVWKVFPFAEDLIMSEDQDWSRRALEAGWRIVYEPRAVVRHSHVYSIGSAFRRFFDSGVSSERAYLAGETDASRVLRRAAVAYLRAEVGWLLGAGRARWIPYALAYETSKLAGLALGTRHRWLPLRLKRRLSAMPSYWNRTGGHRPRSEG